MPKFAVCCLLLSISFVVALSIFVFLIYFILPSLSLILFLAFGRFGRQQRQNSNDWRSERMVVRTRARTITSRVPRSLYAQHIVSTVWRFLMNRQVTELQRSIILFILSRTVDESDQQESWSKFEIIFCFFFFLIIEDCLQTTDRRWNIVDIRNRNWAPKK